MTKIAILLWIFIFLKVGKLHAKYPNDILSDIENENNNLDQYANKLYQTIPTEGVQLIENVFIKKLSENSDESQTGANMEIINPAPVHSYTDNDIFHQDMEDNTIPKNLEKSKLYQRLARKADSAHDFHKSSKSGPLKMSLKSALNDMKVRPNDKQSRILQDIRKLNPKEKEILKMQLQREAPESDILEMISLMDPEERVSEDSTGAALEPQEDKLGESIEVEVNFDKDEKDTKNSFDDPSKSVKIGPPLEAKKSSEDETPISTEISKYKSFSNSDILEKSRNDIIYPVPESTGNSVNCNVYCFRQYYFHFGNDYHCCVQYTENNYQFNLNSEYLRPCLPQCSCCVQNHYVQQNNFVQQNYPLAQQQHVPYQQQHVPYQQQHVPLQQQYVPSQQQYVSSMSHQQNYSPVQQHYVPTQQLYQQNPIEGHYYWPYMYDRSARTYKPYYI